MLSLGSINKKVQRAQAAVPKVVNAGTKQAKQITQRAVAAIPRVINPRSINSVKKAVNKGENAVKDKGKQIIDKKVKDGKERKERILDKLKKEWKDACTTVKRGTLTIGAVTATAVGVADAGRNWSEFQDRLLGRGKYAKADATTEAARGKVNIKPKVANDKGTSNIMGIDEQDESILSKADYVAMIALKYEYKRYEAIGDNLGMDAVMRAMMAIRQQANYNGKYDMTDSNGVLIEEYNYSSDKVATVTKTYVTSITSSNEWREGTKGLYIASYLSGYAPFPYGFTFSKAISASDPVKNNLKLFSKEGLQELGVTSIGDIPVPINKWKVWDTAQLAQSLANPSITEGDFKVVVNSTEDKSLTITTTTIYIKADLKTLYVYNPQVVEIQGGYWRQKAVKEWQYD
ncbi:hypothetical protein SAMN05446037_102060 [Anaerovirgula multivorans]|uniref:Uncharacterized protein n=1 Tax=Anaerovirgula multivorans TaxID=312168 RepID=A0A239H7L7_9FIRM|nr:hypothetical protein [Anaerovirgula multivorans]SNS77399.1 hypothetical protein SAMN05446037_102060 [Anaerovirgula multivorans]